MMFLQYAIWGAWASVLGAYLGQPPSGADPRLYLRFEPAQVGVVFSLLPLAMAFAPFIFGQVADRLLAAQYLIAAGHIASGAVMFLLARQMAYAPFVQLMLLYALLFAPTFALTNSVAFAHMKDSEREFGGVRVWGTLGWIAAGWALTAWRVWLPPIRGDLFILAGALSLVSGLLSFGLPNTPPRQTRTSPFAFLEALKLFRARGFAVFMAISFVVSTQVDFYYIVASPFLEHLGILRSNVPAVLTIAQVAEIFVMALLLPRLLPKLGARKLLALGALAWPLRYGLFALLPIPWVVVSALTLHGFCFVFFFAVGFVYVDQKASADIRSSAQALVTAVVWGLARFIGSRFAGLIQGIFTANGVTDYRAVFLVPCALTLLSAFAFLTFFRDDTSPQAMTSPPVIGK